MPRLVILGSAAAVPDAAHENTYMVLDGDHGSILIDCAGSPIGRLERAGLVAAAAGAGLSSANAANAPTAMAQKRNPLKGRMLRRAFIIDAS